MIQQTIRAERSRRHLITLGTWPTPFVAFASSTKPGQSPGRAGNRTPSTGRSPTDETGIPRPCAGMARTAVTGPQSRGRRHRAAVTGVPTSGTRISGRGYGADRTAADRNARAPSGPPGRCGCWSAGDSRGGYRGRCHPMPTHRHEDKVPLQFSTGSTARLGDNIVARRSGVGSPSNERFPRTGDFGPDLPH